MRIASAASTHGVTVEGFLVITSFILSTQKYSGIRLKVPAQVPVVNAKGVLTGIFTDGDLRRHLEADPNLSVRKVKEVMTKNPSTVTPCMLAAEAMRILKDKKIDELPVVDQKKRPVGLLDVQDLLKAGVV